MSYAILKPKFDGRRNIGNIPVHDGRISVIEGTPQEKAQFAVIESPAIGYSIKEVDIPVGYYYWEHYNQILNGEKTLEELGYAQPEEPAKAASADEPPKDPPRKKATVKRKKTASKAKPEGNDTTGA